MPTRRKKIKQREWMCRLCGIKMKVGVKLCLNGEIGSKYRLDDNGVKENWKEAL